MYVLVPSMAIFLIICALVYRRKSWALFVMPLLFIGLYAPPLHAQDAKDCSPRTEQQTAEETPDTTQPEEFTLVDDVFELTSGETRIFSLLQNDNQLSDDLIDWTTVDLNPSVAGIQNLIVLSHPDDPLGQCGIMRNAGFGTVAIYLNPTCPDDLDLPESFSVSYTAQTQNALSPNASAVITILFNPSPSAAIVSASNDSINSLDDETTVNVLTNDTTTAGVLDPLTIDLDLATPGRQTTVSVVNAGGVMVISVDGSGVVTADYTEYDFIAGNIVELPYVVSNTNGDVSNVALFRVLGATSGDE
jgi:hypothetical protein